MKFLHAPHPGRFVHVLEDHDGTIYRLRIPKSDLASECKLTVSFHGSDPQPLSYTSLRCPFSTSHETIVSFTLAESFTAFDIALDGKLLARMTPELYRYLCARRDFAMVNPAIDGSYHHWLRQHEAFIESHRRTPLKELACKPLISIIVPLYKTPIPYLRTMVESVLAQTYRHWELILVNASSGVHAIAKTLETYDDERLRILEVPENRGIAGNTNVGIEAASGDYIAFFDHDDTLDPRALEMYVRAINAHPDADLLYCDEDNFHETLEDRYAPLLKPDFNLDLLYSHNYVVHMLTISKHALELIELSPDDVSGAQDYDLTLKVCEVARTIVHIPFILYHWRAHAGSTNGGMMESKPYAIQASINALDRHFRRRSVNAHAMEADITCVFNTNYRLDCTPDASAIIVANNAEDARTTVESISSSTAHTHLEPIIVLPEGISWDGNGKTIRCAKESTLTHRINAGLRAAGNPYALLCIAPIVFDSQATYGAVDQIVGCLQRPEVGIVAPKLLYHDGLVAHAGVYVNRNGTVVLPNQNFQSHMGGGYHGYAECSCDVSAVAPYCFGVKTLDVQTREALDENLSNSLLAMVDFCFKVRRSGKLVVMLPTATGSARMPVLSKPFEAVPAFNENPSMHLDTEKLWKRWDATWKRDMLFNPNVSFANGYPNLENGKRTEHELDLSARNDLVALGAKAARKAVAMFR